VQGGRAVTSALLSVLLTDDGRMLVGRSRRRGSSSWPLGDGSRRGGAPGRCAAAGRRAVRTTGLTKRFRSGQVAVDDLELLVPRGSVMGFLGPNGSGKTTTIRMLLGLVTPTSGQVELLGEPIPQASARVLPRVGALVEGPAFHPYLSGAPTSSASTPPTSPSTGARAGRASTPRWSASGSAPPPPSASARTRSA
jgi:ABC-2 type transport system ATP-binding protein